MGSTEIDCLKYCVVLNLSSTIVVLGWGRSPSKDKTTSRREGDAQMWSEDTVKPPLPVHRREQARSCELLAGNCDFSSTPMKLVYCLYAFYFQSCKMSLLHCLSLPGCSTALAL